MEERPKLNSTLCERLTSDTTIEVLIDTTDPSGGILYFGVTLRGEVSPDVQCRIVASPDLQSGVFSSPLFQLLLDSLDLEVKGGGACGFSLTFCCLMVTSVEYCEERSTEMAVRLAAATAIKTFLQQATLSIDNM